jgi:hypothetical protein
VRWLYLAGLALIALYAFGGDALPGVPRTDRVGAAAAGALQAAAAGALRTASGLLHSTAGLSTARLDTAVPDALRTTVLGTTVADMLRTAAAILLALAFTVGYLVLVERAVTGFRTLKPRFCSIYQPLFWRHERFWKVPSIAYIQMFSGTPFKTVVWRLLGVKVGRRVFDDGCSIVERTLVRIGSEATLNAGSILQGHSLEDGTFKSGYITIGARSTVGTGAFFHYGVILGEGAVLGADSFLMKGEHVPPGSCWQGNPAAAAPAPAPAPPGTIAGPPAPPGTIAGPAAGAVAVTPSPASTLPLPLPPPQPSARRPAPRSPARAHSRASNRS